MDGMIRNRLEFLRASVIAEKPVAAGIARVPVDNAVRHGGMAMIEERLHASRY